MSQYQILFDLTYLLPVTALLYGLIRQKEHQGFSFKTQEIILVSLIPNILSDINSMRVNYFTLQKILVFVATLISIFLIKKQNKIGTVNNEKFTTRYIYLSAAVINIIIHLLPFSHGSDFLNFGFWLRIFSVIPQIIVMRGAKKFDKRVALYLSALAFYQLVSICKSIVHAHMSDIDYIVGRMFQATICLYAVYSSYLRFIREKFVQNQSMMSQKTIEEPLET